MRKLLADYPSGVKIFLGALSVAVMIAVGVAGIIEGEADDSPGLQGLSVLLILGALTITVKLVRGLR
jgi:hypothetical protein